STACRPPSMIPRVSRRSRPRSRRWGIRGAEKAAILGALPLGVTGNTPDSGSGESWFEPRRGNSKRDARLSRVALRHFSARVIVSVYVIFGREATLRSGQCRFLVGSPEKGSGEFWPSS